MSVGIIQSATGPYTPYVKVINGPANQTVSLGSGTDSVAFSVDLLANEYVTYQWCKDDAVLTEDSHFTGTTTRTLVIKGIQPSDADYYSVWITHSGGLMPGGNYGQLIIE